MEAILKGILLGHFQTLEEARPEDLLHNWLVDFESTVAFLNSRLTSAFLTLRLLNLPFVWQIGADVVSTLHPNPPLFLGGMMISGGQTQLLLFLISIWRE